MEPNNFRNASQENASPDAHPFRTEGDATPVKSRRGFASMDPERRRQVARNGGRTAHQQGVAHKWSKEEASAAGKKSQDLRRSQQQRQNDSPII